MARVIRPAPIVAALIFITGTSSGDLAGQQLPRIPNCSQCDIYLTKVATLGTASRAQRGAELSQTNIIERDSKGRIYVAPWIAPGEIKVFDSSGRFLRVIGREGDGPGEFRMIRDIIVGTADTMYVFDIALNRETTFSPDWRVIATQQVSLGTFSQDAAVLLGDGRVAVNSMIRTRDLVGLPLHLFDANGHHLRSFGSTDAAFRTDAAVNSYRRLAAGTNNTLWSLTWSKYLAEQWDTTGRRLKYFERDPEWFKPWSMPTIPSASRQSQPTSIAIREDRNGRLWILVQVPDREQASQLRFKNVGPEVGPTWNDPERAFDTMVDVIDVRSGRLLLSKRVPQVVMKMIDDEHFVAYRETSAGDPVFDVWRVRFTQNPSNKR